MFSISYSSLFSFLARLAGVGLYPARVKYPPTDLAFLLRPATIQSQTLILKWNEKDQHVFLGKRSAEPKFREGVPFCYRVSPKRLECANLLARVENVASRAQTQHNTIMNANVTMVWGRGRQWSAEPTKATPRTRNGFRQILIFLHLTFLKL